MSTCISFRVIQILWLAHNYSWMWLKDKRWSPKSLNIRLNGASLCAQGARCVMCYQGGWLHRSLRGFPSSFGEVCLVSEADAPACHLQVTAHISVGSAEQGTSGSGCTGEYRWVCTGEFEVCKQPGCGGAQVSRPLISLLCVSAPRPDHGGRQSKVGPWLGRKCMWPEMALAHSYLNGTWTEPPTGEQDAGSSNQPFPFPALSETRPLALWYLTGRGGTAPRRTPCVAGYSKPRYRASTQGDLELTRCWNPSRHWAASRSVPGCCFASVILCILPASGWRLHRPGPRPLLLQ